MYKRINSKGSRMAIAKPPQPGRLAPRTRNPLPLNIKTLTCVALIVVFCAVRPAPAVADPSPGGSNLNPFGNLSCGCGPSAPTDGATRKQQIRRGMRQGLSGAGHD
ncbi:hypothetical protein [Mycobacterium mantenii]|uniref:hypothetical protein n=1 Tax=Mycobacterium mantenii TaxID=560555 RepID=UPI0010425E6B|nr:hypothetical protein [Mycobacterium mantenii]